MPIIGLVFLLISPAVNSGTDTELVITSWGRPMFVARLAGAPVGGWSKQMYESIYSLQNTVRRISYNTVDSPKYININKYYQGRAGRLHSSAQLATASPCWIRRLEKDLACSREERLGLLAYAGNSNSFNISINRAISYQLLHNLHLCSLGKWHVMFFCTIFLFNFIQFHPQRSERHQGERVKEQGEGDQSAVWKRSRDETGHCRGEKGRNFGANNWF